MDRIVTALLEHVPAEWVIALALAAILVRAPWATYRLQEMCATAKADRDDAILRARASQAAREADDARIAAAERGDDARSSHKNPAAGDELARAYDAAIASSREVREEMHVTPADREAAEQWLPRLANMIPGRRSPRPTSFSIAATARRIRAALAAPTGLMPTPSCEADAWCMALIARGRPAQSAAALVANHTIEEMREAFNEHRPDLVAHVDALMSGTGIRAAASA